ncbi:MAG: transcriptional regulator [Rhodospirillaceae bacterium]|nr:MAG: transcriptional regulator [Rhodospirillaceae bacterium]
MNEIMAHIERDTSLDRDLESDHSLHAHPKRDKSLNRATNTDRHVGNWIRERRVMLGLSQQQMADMIGVTYQQAHKYERGINRISAGRLFEIAQVLGVDVSYFFESIDTQRHSDMNPRQRMCLELARNFVQIKNERHQEALSQLARALAGQM